MSTQVLMPALSPTMTEGKLAKWLKKVGEDVRAGDVIAEIETDKATMEVEAVDEGKLSQILVEEGTDGVAVNTPIAVLSGEGEAAAPAEVVHRHPPGIDHLDDGRRLVSLHPAEIQPRGERDDVAGAQIHWRLLTQANARRSSRGDDVSWLQTHKATDVADQVSDTEDHGGG